MNTVKYSIRVINHRLSGDSTALWYGSTYAMPRTGERVTIPTKKGHRTYKVSRITYDIGAEVHTIEVVHIKDIYED